MEEKEKWKGLRGSEQLQEPDRHHAQDVFRVPEMAMDWAIPLANSNIFMPRVD